MNFIGLSEPGFAGLVDFQDNVRRGMNWERAYESGRLEIAIQVIEGQS